MEVSVIYGVQLDLFTLYLGPTIILELQTTRDYEND